MPRPPFHDLKHSAHAQWPDYFLTVYGQAGSSASGSLFYNNCHGIGSNRPTALLVGQRGPHMGAANQQDVKKKWCTNKLVSSGNSSLELHGLPHYHITKEVKYVLTEYWGWVGLVVGEPGLNKSHLGLLHSDIKTCSWLLWSVCKAPLGLSHKNKNMQHSSL